MAATSAPARRTRMNCGAQPVLGEAQPVSIKADRNSCRTNGWRPASAFHSAASTPARESTTLTDSKFDADPFGHLRIEALDALVLAAQLVAASEAVPDAG